jgi:hypothetical protein
MINHDTDPQAAVTRRGEAIGSTFIGLIVLCWLLYGAYEAYIERGYGSFFHRFLQNTFSCCAVEPAGDLEKAAEMIDIEGRLSRLSTSREDHGKGAEVVAKAYGPEVVK